MIMNYPRIYSQMIFNVILMAINEALKFMAIYESLIVSYNKKLMEIRVNRKE